VLCNHTLAYDISPAPSIVVLLTRTFSHTISPYTLNPQASADVR